MKVVLAALEPDLADAWERHCGDLDCVTVHRGSILDVPCEAVVSPANSFGFMDGGIDRLYSHHFGWEVQDRLQELIRSRHHQQSTVRSEFCAPHPAGEGADELEFPSRGNVPDTQCLVNSPPPKPALNHLGKT